MPIGSHFFLIHLGEEPKGIVGSGITVSDPYPAPHWSGRPKTTAWYVDVQFSALVRPEPATILPLAFIQQQVPAAHNWTPFASGVEVPDEKASRLERLWFDHLRRVGSFLPPSSQLYLEGDRFTFRTSGFRRSLEARRKCLEAHKPICTLCGFSFVAEFGEIGEGYIQVHHLTPLATIGQRHEVDPEKDLCPICANCHAMAHRRSPPFSVQELREIRRNIRSGKL